MTSLATLLILATLPGQASPMAAQPFSPAAAQPLSPLATPSFSQPNDARVRQVEYVANQVVEIDAAPGYQLTISLAPDERIETVAIGNTAAFQATASRSGDMLFVKALQSGAATNMTVVTDVRRYAFTLTASGGVPAAYAIAFRYPKPLPAITAPARLVGQYRLGGAKALWPTRISDDGEHVFIDWAANIDLPAIYALDAQGRESLTNGMMRGGRMVIDAIAPRLVFRLDDTVATASRYLQKPARR